MFSKLIFVLFAALSLSSLAKPIVRIDNNHIKLPFVKYKNFTGTSLVKVGQTRAQFLKTHQFNKKNTPEASHAKRAASAVNVGITNNADVYTADVTIGNPPQPFTLIVDIGSSNTWVGANIDNPYRSTSGRDTGASLFVEYGSGFVMGKEITDTFTIGTLTIPNQTFGVAESSEGFDGFDGILGLGPDDLTEGTISTGGEVLTVTENAFLNGLIPNEVLGISFEPTNSFSTVNGELTFGGVDSSKFTGNVTFVPITSTPPSNEFVGIDQVIKYNGATILDSSGIADTGTTLLLIATDALDAYRHATGAVLDQNTGLLGLTPQQFNNLQSLFFTIGGTTFEFTKNAQLWPRALNTAIGGTEDQILLIVNDIGSPSGEGLDFINGMTFLERFYTVFDAGNSVFGIATTPFTDAITN